MAFSTAVYVDLIKRAHQRQSTVEGRLALLVLRDLDWPFSSSATVQKARVASNIGDSLIRYARPYDRGDDSASLQVIIDEWIVQAGG